MYGHMVMRENKSAQEFLSTDNQAHADYVYITLKLKVSNSGNDLNC